MGLFDNFPYTNFHELNLDWILKVLKNIENTIDEFVSLNIIKYADPIQWDIVRQYPKNTIVIDPVSGTAYISVDNVPQGVPLSNTDYWSVVFDLGRFITLASQNFALSYEAVLTTTATMPTVEGGWVVWNSILYEALNDIHVGDAYVIDGNIKKTPVEEFFNRLKATVTQEILDRQAADITLGGRIDQEILDRQTEIGDLQNLNTIFKGNLVGAINEVFNLPKGAYVNVRDFGAIGAPIYYDKATNRYYADAGFTTPPTSDVAAFESAIQNAINNNKKYIYIPAGYYYLPNKTFGLSENLTFIGEGNTYLVSEGLTGDSNFINITVTTQTLEYAASPVLISGITILGNYFTAQRKTNSNGVVAISVGDAWVQHRNIIDVGVANFDIGFKFRAAVETHMSHCSVFLCNVGIAFNENNGGYNPVPFFFENGTIELNGTGILAPNGGFSTVHVINSGFSGGRLAYYGKANLYLTGCRMEYAIDCLCDDAGTPNAAIEIYSTSGSDADSGLMVDSCEVVTTASGYWDAIDLFVNLQHHTRVANKNYLWHIYQPYAGQSCDAMINNTLYNIGDAPVPILCYAEGGRVTGKIRSTISVNRGTMLGAFTLNAEALGAYPNITHTGGTGINVSGGETVSIKLSTNDSGVIAHLPIAGTITHKYLVNGTVVKTVNITSSASIYYNANTASIKPIGADEVQIVIPDGYYGEAWIEVI